jgi:hypothetical protein
MYCIAWQNKPKIYLVSAPEDGVEQIPSFIVLLICF